MWNWTVFPVAVSLPRKKVRDDHLSRLYNLLLCYPAPYRGIDAEVADFFADSPSRSISMYPRLLQLLWFISTTIAIDDATNKRLRWMVHKRVLVVIVVTYFAQTLDKGWALCESFGQIKANDNSGHWLLQVSWTFARTPGSKDSNMPGSPLAVRVPCSMSISET